jgi:hypothetical protein
MIWDRGSDIVRDTNFEYFWLRELTLQNTSNSLFDSNYTHFFTSPLESIDSAAQDLFDGNSNYEEKNLAYWLKNSVMYNFLYENQCEADKNCSLLMNGHHAAVKTFVQEIAFYETEWLSGINSSLQGLEYEKNVLNMLTSKIMSEIFTENDNKAKSILQNVISTAEMFNVLVFFFSAFCIYPVLRKLQNDLKAITKLTNKLI